MKKCALINDISGFGKCSLGAGIPIISVYGIEAHPIPTAVLSNQTGYSSFKKVDLTEHMGSFFSEWKKLGVHFDGILTGYFSDERQIDAVLEFIHANESAVILADPVMGDLGKRYKGFSDSLCDKITELAFSADIVTPNVTELYLLTGENDIEKGARVMLDSGVKTVIVTGIKNKNDIGNAVFEKGAEKAYYAPYSGVSYSGTGDLLSAVVMGGLLSGKNAFSAVKTATDFISLAARNTETANRNDGIDFEKYLYTLGRDAIEKR